MAYQYKRESLNRDEVSRLEKACESARERMLIRTLLDTGLRISEFTSLTRDNIDWQGGKVVVFGKGGPYGSKSKRRVVPISNRFRPMLEAFLPCTMKLDIPHAEHSR
jgi:integrase/recombinase XerD